MANVDNFYMLCPSCKGSGHLNWGSGPQSPGDSTTCPTCKDGGDNVVKVIGGLRHIYIGRVVKEQE